MNQEPQQEPRLAIKSKLSAVIQTMIRTSLPTEDDGSSGTEADVIFEDDPVTFEADAVTYG